MYFILFLILPAWLAAAPIKISLTAESALLINADTGAVLYQKKPHKKVYPASVTKIATALFALKQTDDLDALITAEQDCVGSVTEEAKQRANYTLPSYWLVKDSSHMGIKKGEEMKLKDLLYGMMVVSADDAANVIAYTLSDGKIPVFMEKLNGYLKELGCKDTYFNNPHGLHHPEHVTSAFDMAIVTREALKNPLFKEIVATTRYTRPKTNKQDPTTLVQTNRLLRSGELYYPKAIGVKTGYTSKAGSTLVAAAKDGERTLIAILFNVKDRKLLFREATQLFEAAFNQPKMEKKLASQGPQKYQLLLPGSSKPVNTYLAEDVNISYYPAEEPQIKAFIQWDTLKLPIARDQKVGELRILAENQLLKAAPLYAQEPVKLKFFERLIEGLKSGPLFWILILTTTLGALFLLRLFRRA